MGTGFLRLEIRGDVIGLILGLHTLTIRNCVSRVNSLLAHTLERTKTVAVWLALICKTYFPCHVYTYVPLLGSDDSSGSSLTGSSVESAIPSRRVYITFGNHRKHVRMVDKNVCARQRHGMCGAGEMDLARGTV